MLAQHLAQRNLLRGYLLRMPSGQSVAKQLNITPLSNNELLSTDSKDPRDKAIANILRDNGFDTRTPLWFYILKESEVRANGHSLGEVGSRIVAETIIGLMQADKNSYLNQGWTPAQGMRLANGKAITTIADFLVYAGVAPDPHLHAEETQ